MSLSSSVFLNPATSQISFKYSLHFWSDGNSNLLSYFFKTSFASDVIGAVKKAAADGRRNLVSVALTKDNSIPHIIQGRAGAAKVIMRPSAPGSGVIAGGSVRTILELAGVKNILAKQLGSSNPLNNARAATDALNRLQTFTEISANRNLTV